MISGLLSSEVFCLAISADEGTNIGSIFKLTGTIATFVAVKAHLMVVISLPLLSQGDCNLLSLSKPLFPLHKPWSIADGS